jgi:hypothetical protein
MTEINFPRTHIPIGVSANLGGIKKFRPFPIPVDEFCNIRNYIEVGAQNATCSIDENIFTAESLVNSGSGGFFCLSGGDEFFELEGEKAWAEVQVNSADCAGCGGGAAVQFLGGKGGGFVGVFAFGLDSVGNGIIVNSDFTPLFTGLTIPLGWTVQLRVDGSNGDVSFEDSLGNSGLLFNVPEIATFQTINFGAVAGGQDPINIGDTVSVTINENYFEPAITVPEDYKPFCQIGREELCGTLIPLDNPFGAENPNVSIFQNNISYGFSNNTGIPQTFLQMTDGTYFTQENSPFVELTFNGADSASINNYFGATFAVLFGIFGLGVIVYPKLQTGTVGAVGLYPTNIRILGEQFTITKPSGVDFFSVNYISGDDTDLANLGLQIFNNSVAGIATSEGATIAPADYSVTNLVFEIQYGANPAATITLSSNNADADTIAADIQAQIQLAGGVYSDITFAKTSDGIDIQTGYQILLGFNFSGLELFYVDSLGNTDTIDLSLLLPPPLDAIVNGQSFPYMLFGNVEAFEQLTVSYNAGRYVPILSLPPEFKGHCNIPVGVKSYFYNQLIFIGGGDIELINNGRTRVLTNNLAESETPNTVDLFGDFAFSATSFTRNCFESEITFYETGVLKEKFSVGLNAVLQTDLRLARENSIGSDLFLQSRFPDLNNLQLASFIGEYQVGDVSTVAVFDNGDFPITPSVQFVIKVGSILVIYDKLKMAEPTDGDNPPYTAFTQSNIIDFPTNNNNPDGNRVEITFNGIDGDYTITDYPEDFLDINNEAMPLSTSPWIRSAEFVLLNYTSNSDRTINYGVGNLSFEVVNGTTAIIEAKAHLPLFAPFAEDESILVGFKADTVNGDFKVEAHVVQLESAKVIIKQVGADVQYQIFNEFGQPSETGNLATGYTIQNNDLIYIQVRNSYVAPVVVSKVDLFLWDALGSQIYKQIDKTYAGSNNSPLPTWSSIFFAGFENVPVSATAKVTSQCKSADMDSNITSQPEISVGAIDLEGNLV